MSRTQIDRYLAALPPASRKVVRKLRADIRAAAPDAEETFSYQMPGFRLHGRAFVWYAAWTNHVSLYPIGPSLVRSLRPALDRCETSKGTVRFPLAKPPSSALVKRIVRARARELAKERK